MSQITIYDNRHKHAIKSTLLSHYIKVENEDGFEIDSTSLCFFVQGDTCDHLSLCRPTACSVTELVTSLESYFIRPLSIIRQL